MLALYTPAFTITPKALDLVVLISEALGRMSVQAPTAMTPKLRPSRRLHTIHSSPAIAGDYIIGGADDGVLYTFRNGK